MRPVSILFLFLLAFSPAPASAQVAPEQSVLAQATPDAAAPADVQNPSLAAQTGAGLPQPNTGARTMRAYWHVFIAFAVVWLLLFGYALTLGRRFGKLEEELRRLRGST